MDHALFEGGRRGWIVPPVELKRCANDVRAHPPASIAVKRNRVDMVSEVAGLSGALQEVVEDPT